MVQLKVSLKNAFAILVIAVPLGACTSSEMAGPRATASLSPTQGSNVNGSVTFTQVGPNRVRLSGALAGHSPGPKGFHIHETGDCSAPDAMSAGGHFNPMKTQHGPSPTSGHAGDMGNVIFGNDGKAVVDFVVEGVSVSRDAPNGIIGRAVIVHMQPDDLKTDPTGNAGGRAACGVIK
jgi:Cu-Zn family superoxide dismutase